MENTKGGSYERTWREVARQAFLGRKRKFLSLSPLEGGQSLAKKWFTAQLECSPLSPSLTRGFGLVHSFFNENQVAFDATRSSRSPLRCNRRLADDEDEDEGRLRASSRYPLSRAALPI